MTWLRFLRDVATRGRDGTAAEGTLRPRLGPLWGPWSLPLPARLRRRRARKAAQTEAGAEPFPAGLPRGQPGRLATALPDASAAQRLSPPPAPVVVAVAMPVPVPVLVPFPVLVPAPDRQGHTRPKPESAEARRARRQEGRSPPPPASPTSDRASRWSPAPGLPRAAERAGPPAKAWGIEAAWRRSTDAPPRPATMGPQALRRLWSPAPGPTTESSWPTPSTIPALGEPASSWEPPAQAFRPAFSPRRSDPWRPVAAPQALHPTRPGPPPASPAPTPSQGMSPGLAASLVRTARDAAVPPSLAQALPDMLDPAPSRTLTRTTATASRSLATPPARHVRVRIGAVVVRTPPSRAPPGASQAQRGRLPAFAAYDRLRRQGGWRPGAWA